MTRVLLEGIDIRVPTWVVDLESFRRWSDDDDFPETGQISFLNGEVWIDMSKEQLFTHNQVKNQFAKTLTLLAEANQVGRYFPDGAFISNEEADVSNQPDGMYYSFASHQAGRVRIIEGREEGHVELEGSPDMVLEVVSPSSVGKDTKVLREAYALANIFEYWLVDARKDPLRFDVLRLSRSHYVAARKRGDWVRSEVFDHWFRLRQDPAPDGFPTFRLEAQTEKPG